MNTVFNNTYANYFELAVAIDRDTRTFRCMREGRGVIADNVCLTFEKADGTVAFDVKAFAKAEYIWEQPPHIPCTKITQRLTEGGEGIPSVIDVVYTVWRDRIDVKVVGLPADLMPVFRGCLIWGKVDDCFAVCLNRDDAEKDFRSALGPAVSPADDALFDRMKDEALIVEGGIGREIGFCWACEHYTATVKGDLTLRYLGQVFEQKFRTRYKPINKNNTFPKPPAGWMTWYAVLFNAGEKAVLENAKKQKEYFYDYGADTIWVDWEWYHEAFDNPNAPQHIGYFSPDPVRYPNGLKYVSDEIRKLGFTPALWVGPTSEPTMTDTVKKYIDSVYVDKVSWCGQYFFDITDERIRDELIPAAFEKVKEWGYDALKWDCLPITLAYADQFHEYLKHPEMTSVEALRALCQKAREVMGEDFYMLSCAGVNDREVMMASDIFDAARIGNDIFKWHEFISDFVERILRFYPYHNTVLYCDPDNVVIRPEFNDYEQAKSRVSTVSLLGLPVTLGDDLTQLPMERVELLRRALPTLDAHPKDLREGTHDGKRFLINLAINRPFEAWNVAAVLNLLENEADTTVDLSRDLKLADGEYLVYDYWNHRFLGTVTDSLTVTLPGTATAVLSVRKKTGRPQVVSTSRHVTQGAVDLLNVTWDEETRTLSGTAKVVKDDPYCISIYVPEGYAPTEGTVTDGILELTPDNTANGAVAFSVRF